MAGTFQVTGTKNGQVVVCYHTTRLYNGVVNDVIDIYEKQYGWKVTDVHLIG